MATRTRNKVDPETVYVAWQGAAVEVDGSQYLVKRGEHLLGSHPAVRALGLSVFAPDGTPDSERGSVHDSAGRVIEREVAAERKHAAAARAPRISPDTPVSELSVCVRAVTWSAFGEVPEGEIRVSSDPAVLGIPEAWTPLASRLT